MDSAVSHAGGRPVYHRANVVFTSLAVHREEVDGVEYTIYYAGSRDGRVFKLVQGNTGSQQPYSELVDVMRVTSPEPVRSMEFSAKHRALYVASDSGQYPRLYLGWKSFFSYEHSYQILPDASSRRHRPTRGRHVPYPS